MFAIGGIINRSLGNEVEDVDEGLVDMVWF
jgi:hypothetical protein